ncbi:hypothetical protein BH20BAC1_BH20BAC1_29050 [soil metagenome]
MEQVSTGKNHKATYLPKNENEYAYPADRTVLLVIDPVNDFLSEGGAAWELTKKTVEMNDVIPNMQLVISAVRAKGIPVLYGPMAYTEEDYAHEHLQKRSGINRMMYEMKMFQAGSWGADFHPELKPQDGDVILQPHKSCDVYQTDLAEELKKRGTTHIVIIGMTANLCCESTGRHAMEEGYDVTFISDAIGAAGVMEYEAAINVNFPLIANAVIKTEDFLNAIEYGASGMQIQEGDTVRGSDGGEIGTVKEVQQDSEDIGYMLVPMGMIFKEDTYIPLDTVIKRTGSDIIINIPKMVAGKMPWSKPPTAEVLNEKQGQPAAEVEKLYQSYAPTNSTAAV